MRDKIVDVVFVVVRLLGMLGGLAFAVLLVFVAIDKFVDFVKEKRARIPTLEKDMEEAKGGVSQTASDLYLLEKRIKTLEQKKSN